MKLIRYKKTDDTILAAQGKALLVCLDNSYKQKDGTVTEGGEACIRTSAWLNYGRDDWREVSREGRLIDVTVSATWEELEKLATDEYKRLSKKWTIK